MNFYRNKYFIILLLPIFFIGQEKFKIVLDAGHGGHDAGTHHYGLKEKDVVLDVVLRVGKLLEKHADIEVVYTRKTDVFVELYQRAKIANKAKANLFLSIHCNGFHTPTPNGTETFVLGMSKNASNLEVVKKENSVVSLETNTKDKYQGFDPNKTESVIGITLMQEEFIDQSIILASKIQKSYSNQNNLFNRGVKQGPFLVLNQTAMPSVLTEIGFISNPDDNKYLKSDNGKSEITNSIYEAVIAYKNEFYGSSSESKGPTESKESNSTKKESNENDVNIITTVKNNNSNEIKVETGLVYKVQIKASYTILNQKAPFFKGLQPVSYFEEGGFYKYTYGEDSTLDSAKNTLKEVKNLGFKDAFIVCFFNNKKISIQEAQKLEK